MARTFEELASEALDALYQGAMFLSGGDRLGAEQLLVDALVCASEAHIAQEQGGETRLEAVLAQTFVGDDGAAHTFAEPVTGPSPTLGALLIEPLDPQRLFAAAGTLPPLPRAAVWLVLLKRWSYSDAAATLGVAEESLPGLLAFRDLLIREIAVEGGAGSARVEETGS